MFGYQVAFCWRNTAIYGGTLLFGILYGLARDRNISWLRWLRKPIPLWAFLVLLLPMAVDGVSHLLGLRDMSDNVPMDIWYGALYGTGSQVGSSNWWLRIITGLLAALPALASPGAQTQGNLDHLGRLSGQEFEIEFMSMMIEHHQSALDMAGLAPGRAKRQGVEEIALKIAGDQTREINDMTNWLQQWYGTAPTPGLIHDVPGTGAFDVMRLAQLKGDAFDRTFLVMMRIHHTGTAEMAALGCVFKL